MRLLVAGIGTDVGKTHVSQLLVKALNADYWKPIQTGLEWDGKKIETAHSSSYHFRYPSSPYLSAQREHIKMDLSKIVPPHTERPLVIEAAGGVCVPLTETLLCIDLFVKWQCDWILVANHYLGSVNHTLLSIEALQNRGIFLKGVIYNDNLDQLPLIDQSINEQIITRLSGVPRLARVTYQSNHFDSELLL